MSILNRDVETALQIPINRRERDRDVEGNLVARGQDGLRVGADLVRDFAGAAERAVAADDDQVNLPALHQMAGGVVGDDLVRDFLLRQLPRGERRALGTRTGFVAEDVEFFALRLRGIHRRGGGADVHERQPAGVAMRENPHAIADQFRAVLADRLAMLHVFAGEFLGGGEREELAFCHRLSGTHVTADVIHRVDGIHGGGPCIFQNLINRLDVGGEFLQVAAAKGKRALRQAVGGGGADGSGAAHDHVGDGGGGGAEIRGGDDLEFVREQPLLDEEDGVLCAVKGDGAEMLGAAPDGDIHFSCPCFQED